MAAGGTICRTSKERGAFELIISSGCPYNECAFCNLYKGVSYRERSLEDIEADLIRVHNLGGTPKRVMLGDGNALFSDFDRLKAILDMIEKHLPSIEQIVSDASVPSIAGKTDEQLRYLASHGYNMVYVGIESGLDDVLAFMNKDHDNDEARVQIKRLHDAGINFGAHIMTNVAGAGRGIENARATAALLNELQPVYVCNFSMTVSPLTELGLYEEEGLFTAATELESLEEERELVSLLNIQGEFESYHIETDHSKYATAREMNDLYSRWIHPKGKLPEGRQRILDKIDEGIEMYRQDELERSEEGEREVA